MKPRTAEALSLHPIRATTWAIFAALSFNVHGECAGPNTYLVDPITAPATVSVGGTVVSFREVTLSAQLPGRVELIAGTEGDRFAEGDVLLKLGIDDLLAQRQAAQSQLASANVALRNAEVQYGRELVSPQVGQSPGGMGMPAIMDQFFTNPMQNMMGTRRPGAERAAELHARGAQREQARQSLSQAQSRLREIDAKVRDSKSLAPFDGVIAKKYVEVGDPVQPGQPLLDYIDPDALQVQVDVPARLRTGLREGDSFSANLDTSAERVAVRLARIFPTADATRHTVRMKFDLPAATQTSSGTYAEVVFPEEGVPGRRIIAVPRSAVLTRGGLKMLFTATDTGTADLRFVRTGTAIDDQRVRVLSGLVGGECIVVEPRPGMRAGDPVEPSAIDDN